MSRKVGDSLYRIVKREDEPGYIIREVYNRNRAETFAVGTSKKVYTTPEDAEKDIAALPERRLHGDRYGRITANDRNRTFAIQTHFPI